MHPKCAHCDADAVIDPTMPDGINLPLCTKHASEHAAAIHGVQQHRGPFGECDREPCASAHLQALREYERSMLGGAAANKMLAVERDRTVEQYRDRLAEVNAENAILRRGMICGECSQNTSHRGGAWWTDEYLTIHGNADDLMGDATAGVVRLTGRRRPVLATVARQDAVRVLQGRMESVEEGDVILSEERILPEQLYVGVHRTTPEKKLLLAVLESAVRSLGALEAEERQEAERWFDEPNCGLVTFSQVCEAWSMARSWAERCLTKIRAEPRRCRRFRVTTWKRKGPLTQGLRGPHDRAP